MDQWKQALVALHAAITALLVAGVAQWVYYVSEKWQCIIPLCARIGYESREFECAISVTGEGRTVTAIVFGE